ncbi:aspartate--tRNA ligase, partial [Vibrio parahaemolyticus V-223/04]
TVNQNSLRSISKRHS